MKNTNNQQQSSFPQEEAKKYLQLGFRPIPLCTPAQDRDGCLQHGPNCTSPGKLPLIKWGKLSDITEDDIKRWWKRWPKANIGAIMGVGIVGLDIDPRNGGWETLAELQISHPETVTSITGGGGEHWFFSINGTETSSRVLGLGVELHGKGTLLVLPSSLHISGQHYKWKEGFSPEGHSLAPLPPELTKCNRTGTKSSSNKDKSLFWEPPPDWLESALVANGVDPKLLDEDPTPVHSVLLRIWHEGVSEGRRWLTLNALLREARQDGCTANDLKSLAQAFSDRCVPPLAESEWRRLFRWIRHNIHPRDPDIEKEARGRPSLEAWTAGYWSQDEHRMANMPMQHKF